MSLPGSDDGGEKHEEKDKKESNPGASFEAMDGLDPEDYGLAYSDGRETFGVMCANINIIL